MKRLDWFKMENGVISPNPLEITFDVYGLEIQVR